LDIINVMKENWLLSIIVFVVFLFIFFFLLRTVFKLALIVGVIGAVMVFGFGYSPTEVFNIGKDVAGKTNDLYLETVQPIIEKELENAEYATKPDGTYSIKTNSVELVGKKGGNAVTIYFKDQEFVVDISHLGAKIQEQIASLEAQQ
jgi:hypothetical protein